MEDEWNIWIGNYIQVSFDMLNYLFRLDYPIRDKRTASDEVDLHTVSLVGLSLILVGLLDHRTICNIGPAKMAIHHTLRTWTKIALQTYDPLAQ